MLWRVPSEPLPPRRASPGLRNSSCASDRLGLGYWRASPLSLEPNVLFERQQYGRDPQQTFLRREPGPPLVVVV
jgi:hypothetical protein